MSQGLTPKNFVTYKDVTLELRDIVNSNQPLQQLAGTPLKVMLSYKVSKALKALDKEIEAFSNARKAVLDKYGKFDEEKKTYSYENENEKLAEDELNAMLDKTVTFKVPEVSITELEGETIEPRILAILDWYITD